MYIHTYIYIYNNQSSLNCVIASFLSTKASVLPTTPDFKESYDIFFTYT